MAWNEPGNKKDPWSGGPGKGPDLDELLKRLKERFAGRGRGGGTPGTPGSPFGQPPQLGWLPVAIVALWLMSGFYIVDGQERAAVLRFGAYTRTAEQGPHWRMPWPFEKVEKVNVTQVRPITDRSDMLTQDENIVDVEVKVQYRVSKVEDYLFNVDDPDGTVKQTLKSALREVVGRSNMDFILTDGRQKVASETKQLIQGRLDAYKTGLIVSEVNLQQVQPPEQVQGSFADAIKAREDQQRLKNEAEAYANDRLPRARGGAARQTAEASAYRDRVVARAKGDASRFTAVLREYQKAPRVTRERLYLDAMAEVLGSSSKILLDVNKGNPMLYLPLEQLMKNLPRAAEAGAAEEATAVPEVTVRPPDREGRSRNRGDLP